jgi:hypothetical protein
MRNFLLSIPSYVLLPVILLGSALFAMAATYAVRKQVDEQVHKDNTEVAGFIFAAVGVIYGVLLAFMVLVVWQEYAEANVSAQHEANALANVYRLAGGFPDPFGPRLQAAAVHYGRTVVADEWPKMAVGEPSERATEAIESLWAIHRELHLDKATADEHEDDLFQSLERLSNERRIRLLASRDELPGLLWLLLIGGGLVTIGFTLFLRAPNSVAHLLMAAAFAALVAFVIFLIVELDNPFAGEVHVRPIALEQTLQLFEYLQER